MVAFGSRPTATMRSFSGRTSIEGVLVLFVGMSLALSHLIMLAGFSALDKPSQRIVSTALGLFTRMPHAPWSTGLLFIASLVILSAMFHLIAFGYDRLLNLTERSRQAAGASDFRLGGSVWATLNAVLSFATLYLPLVAIIETAGTVSYFHLPFEDQRTLFWLSTTAMVGALFWYLPAALAGTHRTSFRQALSATALAAGLILGAISWIWSLIPTSN